jgi:hypothetical protein
MNYLQIIKLALKYISIGLYFALLIWHVYSDVYKRFVGRFSDNDVRLAMEEGRSWIPLDGPLLLYSFLLLTYLLVWFRLTKLWQKIGVSLLTLANLGVIFHLGLADSSDQVLTSVSSLFSRSTDFYIVFGTFVHASFLYLIWRKRPTPQLAP